MRKLTTILLLLAAIMPSWAANKLPMDPDVRTGTLPNGLTYYIRHNQWPENRADFYIAQRVGSVNEDDSQRGLAHFLEHMCFNGTRHFPGNSLISYLESIGVKFGANLNAYTSTDETVYNICEVPTTRTSSLDSCLLILRDWSHGLTLADKDIDEERGVIEGEWRQRQGTSFNRMLEKAAPRIFSGSKYGERMPIGKMDVVKNFRHQTLRDYYDKWYWPENQCVIVVGDVNPDSIEAKIKSLWADVERPAHNVVPAKEPIPSNASPLAVVEHDPEQGMSMVQIYIKHPSLADLAVNTIAEMRREMAADLLGTMLAERFDIIESQPEAPFSNLGVGDHKLLLANQQEALLVRANAKTGREAEAIGTIAAELQRAAIHGFTEPELQRAKIDYRAAMDKEYVNRAKITNTQYARKYVRHYLDGGALPSIEQYYKMMKGVINQVDLKAVNDYLASIVKPDGSDVVIIGYLPEIAEVTATEADLARAYSDIDLAALEPYVDKAVSGSILAQEPQAGNIVDEKSIEAFGSKIWTLSNGIKVHLKHTDTNPGQVLVQAFSPGGFSQGYDPALATDYRLANNAIAVSAFGPYSQQDLRRMLVGKNVKTSVSIENMEERMAANTTPDDLADALRMLHLKATDIRPDENAFRSMIENQRMQLSSHTGNPTFAMGDSIHYHIYNHHPLGEKLKSTDLDAVSYSRILDIYRDRFADMSDFTFYVTGAFNEDSLRQLVCRYIASLPGKGRVETPRDIDYRFTPGNFHKRFTRPMTTPQTIAYTFYHSPSQYNVHNVVAGQMLGSMIQSRLRQVIREDRGWTYSVKSHIGISAGMNGQDQPEMIMPVYIKVAPENAEATFATVHEIVSGFTSPDNIDAAELDKVRQFMLKSYEQNASDNVYWLTVMHMYDKFGQDMHTTFADAIRAMTVDDIAAFAKAQIPGASHITLEMSPE